MFILSEGVRQTGVIQILTQKIESFAGGSEFRQLLATFYLGTAIITEVVSNNASVVLMLPIAVDVAGQLGVNAFAFALAVTFAASTPLLSPVGYQTDLMVYGPGGYKFTDFARVGAPLQLILTVVTTAGIVFFWGV